MFRYVGWTIFFLLLQACGKNNLVPSAAGALSGITKDFPGVVMVVMPAGNGYCTGVIVSERAVLTAAHCLQTNGRYSVMAPVGMVSTYEKSSLGSGAVEDTSDIGFLVFDKRIVADDTQIYRIGQSAKTGEAVTLVGFGCSSTETKLGGGAKRTGTNVISEAGDYLVTLTPKNFNAGIIGDRNQAGTCFGDSGGPLFRKAADGALEVVGVVHAGGSDSSYYYSEFVDVSNNASNRNYLKSVETQEGIDVAGI